MPTVQGRDYNFGDLTVPGSGPYTTIVGTPVRDTSIVPSGYPSSLLIDTTATPEYVIYAISGSPTMGWHGFWFYQATGEESASDVDVARMAAPTVGDSRLSYAPGGNQLYQFMPGSGFSSYVITLDAWHWCEQIYDVGTTTAAVYSRIDGVDLTPVTATTSISFVNQTEHGQVGSVTCKYRLADIMWGSAASIADWLGQPTAPVAAAGRVQSLSVIG